MIDLNKFCANKENDERDYLWKPLTVSGQDVASNGHILVRLNGVSTNATHEKRTKLIRLCHDIDDHKLLNYTQLIIKPSKTKCDDCDGRGDFSHGAHRYDCKGCGGRGEVDFLDCSQCPTRPVAVGSLRFRLQYLLMLLELPNVQYLLDDKTRIMFFNFDGGDGCLAATVP